MKIGYIKVINDGLAEIRVVLREFPCFEEIELVTCTLAQDQLQAYCIINKIDKVFIERKIA